MRILVLLIVLGIALAGPAVFHMPVGDDACAQPCPGDSPEGNCPPICDACVCCFAVSPMTVLLNSEFDVVESCENVADDCVDVSESASPIDIFHVPRLLPA